MRLTVRKTNELERPYRLHVTQVSRPYSLYLSDEVLYSLHLVLVMYVMGKCTTAVVLLEDNSLLGVRKCKNKLVLVHDGVFFKLSKTQVRELIAGIGIITGRDAQISKDSWHAYMENKRAGINDLSSVLLSARWQPGLKFSKTLPFILK